MKKALYLFLFLLSIHFHSIAQTPEYGLHIQSYPLKSSEYTSVILDNGNPINTSGKEIVLSFKLWVRKENVFGAIFRIITDKNRNIDLMYSKDKNDHSLPILVTGNNIHYIQKEIRLNTWIDVHLSLNTQNGNISLEYDKTSLKTSYPLLKNAKNIRIAFGFCPFDKFILSEVASINIKDINITRNGKLIRSWKMARHTTDTCYDDIENSPASVKNGSWIINKYITWNQIYTQRFETSPSIAFDSKKNIFYFATNNKKLFIFNPSERKIDSLQVRGGQYVSNYPNQLIYVTENHQLLSYNLDENLYSIFNFKKQVWENSQSPQKEHNYWNNTITYNPADSSLVSFGGYGHYHYNNELLINYPYNKDKKQLKINLKHINPRRSSASAIVDSVLYLFGGWGCLSGRQELSPKNYYDLYSVNLKNNQVKKIWEITQSPMEGDFQPSENMIYNKQQNCFYMFSSQQGGSLIRINAKYPQYDVMSLPIGINFNVQYIYNNIYFSQRHQKLYTAIHMAEANGNARLEIYEINYPPVLVKDLNQVNKSDKAIIPQKQNILTYIIIISSVIFLICLIAFYNKKKIVFIIKNATNKEAKRSENQLSTITDTHITDSIPHFDNYNFSKKCICLFGEFRVIDNEGKDITSQFTPTLKALLILLILYTGKNAKGIISHKLIQILWSDKSDESAKNNRNVYMSKLRTILEKVGDIKIINQNGFWSIKFEKDTVCDYLEAIKLFNKNSSLDLEKLLELLLRGTLLPNMEIEWIDNFKNDFSNSTIDLLCKLLKRSDLSDSLKLKIADILFQHDYINEEALSIKCSILSQQGKIGLAKTVYDGFCKEYHASLGIEYPYTLIEIIKKQNCENNV